MLRIVFAGTPEFAVPSLNAVIDSGHDIVGVWTQPDRPAGRGQKVATSPVKQRALASEIPVFQPESLKTLAAKNQLRDLQPDLMIVVAYGLILPKSVLAMPKHGCWNVHGSILPRWRGAAPIQRAVLAGDAETGVCLMHMEAGLDTGPVLITKRTRIGAVETASHLHDRLAVMGADALHEGLVALTKGALPPAEPQPEIGVTYAHKIEKSEALIDWHCDVREVDQKVRAFSGWPIAEAQLAGERVRIHAGEIAQPGLRADRTPMQENAGQVVRTDGDGIEVQCGNGVYRITQLQRAGGRAISAKDFLNARQDLRRMAVSR